MSTIVTGAAGLIGSNLVKALNERGITDIIAVDNLTKAVEAAKANGTYTGNAYFYLSCPMLAY